MAGCYNLNDKAFKWEWGNLQIKSYVINTLNACQRNQAASLPFVENYCYETGQIIMHDLDILQ